MHLDDERIQRILHGEIDAATRSASERHLEKCAECRRRLEEAGDDERFVFDLLRYVDHPAPAIDPGAVARRSDADTFSVWARRAAGIVLTLAAAGIAYTAPGSPMPGWMNRVTEWIASPSGRMPSPAPVAPSEPVSSGIAVVPGERFTIRFTSTQPAGMAVISLTDGAKVVARTLNGKAIFLTETDRLTIENTGSTADYEIELPRGASWVEVEVDGRRHLLKRGPQLVTQARQDSLGRYILRLDPDER